MRERVKASNKTRSQLSQNPNEDGRGFAWKTVVNK